MAPGEAVAFLLGNGWTPGRVMLHALDGENQCGRCLRWRSAKRCNLGGWRQAIHLCEDCRMGRTKPDEIEIPPAPESYTKAIARQREAQRLAEREKRKAEREAKKIAERDAKLSVRCRRVAGGREADANEDLGVRPPVALRGGAPVRDGGDDAV